MATALPGLPSQTPSGKDGFSKALMIGTSLLGGGSAVFVIVQLIRDEPAKSFDLMNRWGPGYLLALFLAVIVERLIRNLIDSWRVTAGSSADAVRELAVQVRGVAEANSRQAAAMQALADKDDREKQEMQILIGVLNQKVEQVREEQKPQGDAIRALLEEQMKMGRALMRIEDKLGIQPPAEGAKK